MDVSIIIVSYNSCSMTESCIDSIYEFTSGLDFEVIVIDNASADNSAEILGNDRRIKYINAGSNLGFGRANNLGLQHSCGEYILFLNSDTLVQSNVIFEMFSFLSANGCGLDIGGVGSILLGKDGYDTHSSASFPKPWESLHRVWNNHFRHLLGKSAVSGIDEIEYKSADDRPYYEVDYVTGADLMTSRAIVDRYGAFDADFFLYYEESEMQFRWKRSGLHNVILPIRGIVHLEGGSTGQPSSNSRIIYQMRSELLYFRKTMAHVPFVFFRFCYALAHMPMLLNSKYSIAEKKVIFHYLH